MADESGPELSVEVKRRLAVTEAASNAAKKLDPLQQLVIVGQEDDAETRLGNFVLKQQFLEMFHLFEMLGDSVIPVLEFHNGLPFTSDLADHVDLGVQRIELWIEPANAG